MFWFCWEWAWDLGHFIFHGLWYSVLAVMGLGLTLVVGKTVIDLMMNPAFPPQPGHEDDSHH